MQFDGVVWQVDQVPEDVARDWLWEHIRCGTVQSSVLKILEVTPGEYAGESPLDKVRGAYQKLASS
jgi:hypothetical protein